MFIESPDGRRINGDHIKVYWRTKDIVWIEFATGANRQLIFKEEPHMRDFMKYLDEALGLMRPRDDH